MGSLAAVVRLLLTLLHMGQARISQLGPALVGQQHIPVRQQPGLSQSCSCASAQQARQAGASTAGQGALAFHVQMPATSLASDELGMQSHQQLEVSCSYQMSF